MRLLLALLLLSLSIPAQASQPTPGCGYRFYGGNHPIQGVEGYKVDYVQPEYQTIQVYGEVRARYRTERRPAWDGGPMETIRTEISPAGNSMMQRKMVRPGYFVVKDAEDKQVAQFENHAEVQNYVCSVLIPLYRE